MRKIMLFALIALFAFSGCAAQPQRIEAPKFVTEIAVSTGTLPLRRFTDETQILAILRCLRACAGTGEPVRAPVMQARKQYRISLTLTDGAARDSYIQCGAYLCAHGQWFRLRPEMAAKLLHMLTQPPVTAAAGRSPAAASETAMSARQLPPSQASAPRSAARTQAHTAETDG